MTLLQPKDEWLNTKVKDVKMSSKSYPAEFDEVAAVLADAAAPAFASPEE